MVEVARLSLSRQKRTLEQTKEVERTCEREKSLVGYAALAQVKHLQLQQVLGELREPVVGDARGPEVQVAQVDERTERRHALVGHARERERETLEATELPTAQHTPQVRVRRLCRQRQLFRSRRQLLHVQ